jgi:transcriptional antiterminator NusG
MADFQMKWYILRTVSGKEAKVKEYLENAKKINETLGSNVGEVLLPTEKHAKMTADGKRVVKEKLLLPGYLLVQAHLQGEVAHMLRFLPNVLGFLGGLDNPTPVPQAEVNRMIGTAEESIVENIEMDNPYKLDDTIKVTDGPFSGFNGVIEEVNAEKRKLKVMVKIFGRKTPLELSFNQVEKE